MTKEAQFKYKCRQCGDVYGDSITRAVRAQLCLVAVIAVPAKKLPFTEYPPLLNIHDCSKSRHGGDSYSGEGIADLIGYDLKD